ncbi:probable leucine-rich repeat receptor-like protein kinase IMK3 [Ananas comosus]|uniref:Probable leucine-rich repeat receptor-like protein kinase IMK3 n=1 Tax=Ananas comosus TaxID=4615 RepID=A0A6P5FLK9_ANACO|nr:probable leucine-rich repeat receptor-like protein kinase IMK3 [Ananas comosus]
MPLPPPCSIFTKILKHKMHSKPLPLLLTLLSLISLSHSSSFSSCPYQSDLRVLSLAFASVSNFCPPIPAPSRCDPIQSVLLPSENLTGSVSWMVLRNLSALRSLDLSGNALQGSIPGRFWSHPALAHVNLSSNRLGGALRFGAAQSKIILSLDVSANRFTAVSGLSRLARLEYLDLSRNSIVGVLPDDLPPLSGLRFLNVSHNNFSGRVDDMLLKKFGRSAFIKAGINIKFVDSAASSPSSSVIRNAQRKTIRKRSARLSLIIGLGFVALVGILLFCMLCAVRRSKKGKGKERKDVEEAERKEAETEGRWAAEADWAEPENDAAAAAAAFRELARLRHPNLLPLLGYCISGPNKLLLYEYMERGDLHQWLHELPPGRPDVEDWSGDTWELGDERRATLGDWPTRHRIALGVARGLAFLHQGWAGSGRAVVHGHVVPSNVLLAEDLEPRIADFGKSSGATPEDDVYSFGVVVMELLTGRAGWDECSLGPARGMVREGRGLEVVDPRLTTDGVSPETEKEMVECLRVGYLCTAQSPEKRPTMQQVVGLLKDVRPASATSSSASSC